MLSTLAGYYRGQYVSNFNRYKNLYRVMIQSSPEYRVAPESLDKIFTRTGSGEAVPGYSSGDAIRAIREVAASNLPRGYSFEFAGISREESQTTGNTAIIFLICTVFVYLILCGLYESFFVPVFFILFQYLQEKVKPVEFLPAPDWEIQSEMEAIAERKKEKHN